MKKRGMLHATQLEQELYYHKNKKKLQLKKLQQQIDVYQARKSEQGSLFNGISNFMGYVMLKPSL